MSINKNVSIFNCPTHVGNFSVSFRDYCLGKGIKSYSLVLRKSPFFSDEDTVVFTSKSKIINEFRRLKSLSYLFSNYSVLFYNFGSSVFGISSRPKWYKNNIIFFYFYHYFADIIQTIELIVAKIFKKKIIVLYQGHDARIVHNVDSMRNRSLIDEMPSSYYNHKDLLFKYRSICRFSKYADAIYYHNPDLIQYLPAFSTFLPYCHVNVEAIEHKIKCCNSKLRIGHAPSNRSLKGTKYILEAIDNLRLCDYQFEFVMIENLSNKDALEKYRTLDVFIDQLLIGWYGGVAVEVMALGIPVVCYIEESDLHAIPAEMAKDLPIIRSTKYSIFESLKFVLEMDKDKLRQIGRSSRRYVETYHSQKKLFTSLLNDVENLFKKK